MFSRVIKKNIGQKKEMPFVQKITATIINVALLFIYFLENTGKAYPAGIYLLKVNNRNTRTRCKIGSMLTTKDTRTMPIASFWCLYC